MNWELIKQKICSLIITASVLLDGVIICSAVSGSMPLWAALLGLFASVVLLNAACGVLLGAPAKSAAQSSKRASVQLRVVRGGHAA